MFISKITINNFRNFDEANILFNPGLNIIIGHNNAGKTNLIKAMQFVLDREFRIRLSIDDFCKTNLTFASPPSIEISLFIKEYKDKKDDKNVVYDWLIQDSPEYIAQLTYVFELPTKHHEEYDKRIKECVDSDGNLLPDECLRLIEKKFLPKYTANIYGGLPAKQDKADLENLDRFDFQFLNAIRDAGRQMFFGNNTLLRDILNYFLDYDLTKGQGFENLTTAELLQLKKREDDFRAKSKELIEMLISRIDRDQILKYSKETGADKGGVPNFDANITEQEMLFALRLIVEKSGFKIPIKNNGLGYNNLLFIALILSKMQMESSAYMGDNAKVFPVLAIEEPEAHLHPSMQSKFLKFLESNLKTNEQARQIFVTSHSTHITSAVDLDSIICLYENIDKVSSIGYPSRVFNLNNNEDVDSKLYVERFLDANKSNMLFAERLIFVEGLAEQLLLPCFAQYIELEESLVDEHTAIISVDSRTFKHFLKMFAYREDDNIFAINKRVVCITDADPTIKKNNRWVSTFPFALDATENSKSLSSHVIDIETDFASKCNNIFVYSPEGGKGKTLEYEIAKVNSTSELLITDSFPKQNSVHTVENYKALLAKYDDGLDELINEYKDKLGVDDVTENEILNGISSCNWNDNERKESMISAIYYKIVSTSKGAHAFYLEQNLRKNFIASPADKKPFVVPIYIVNALNKIVE